ncbi:MAG: sulfate transporter [Rhizobacter sp.]|nr:sulfate transporter [Rhizobacter sp.]
MSRVLTRLFGPWTLDVGRATWRPDLLAGLLGAVLVLPQGIAFATLAGLPPQYGLYTAVLPCAVAALFGSSRFVMSGPSNAISLALFAMLSPLAPPGGLTYLQLVFALTLMVGAFEVLLGVLRLGALANFISPEALLGFTAGAAVLIVIHALPDALGLPAPPGHAVLAVLSHVGTSFGDVNVTALALAAITVAVTVVVRRIDSRWPAMLIGLAVATAVSAAVNAFGARVGLPATRAVGAIPSAWPPFQLPEVSWSQARELIGLALAMTIVCLGQTIAIAKAVAAKSGERIDANREFIGQGLSNLVGGMFSSYVSSGSMNRSMPNFEAGARTPLSAAFAGALLVALVAISSPLLALIPMAGIAGLLLLVALSLLDLPRWKRLARLGRTEFAIALATFAATLTIRLELAILVGTLLSLVTYLYRTSKPAMRTMGFDSVADDRRLVVIDEVKAALPECKHLKMMRMEGAVYFGATQHVADRLHAMRSEPNAPKHLLVMSKSMNFIDLAGAELWQAELEARRAMGGDLYFHRPRSQVLEMWARTGFLTALGHDHLFPDKHSAISAVLARFGPDPCIGCEARVFRECQAAAIAKTRSAPGLPTSEPSQATDLAGAHQNYRA